MQAIKAVDEAIWGTCRCSEFNIYLVFINTTVRGKCQDWRENAWLTTI